MTAELITIADAARDLIAAATTLSAAPAEVSRCYVPRLTRDSLPALRVYVMGVEEEGTRAARSLWSYVYTLQIVVAKLVEADTPAFVDPLVNFTQEVADLFRNVRLGSAGVVENGVEIIPYDYDKLKAENRFLSMVELKFEGGRDA